MSPGQDLKVTGGGAFKFSEILSEKLDVKIQKTDEMQSLMAGLNCILSNGGEVFRYDLVDKKQVTVQLVRALT